MTTKNSMSQVTRKPSQPATEGIPGKRFRPFRRTRKVIGAIALTARNHACIHNGQRGPGTAGEVEHCPVRSPGGGCGRRTERRSGWHQGGQPLVLLSGFSTVAPALDFSP